MLPVWTWPYAVRPGTAATCHSRSKTYVAAPVASRVACATEVKGAPCEPAVRATPRSRHTSSMRRPRSSVAIHVARSTACSRTASPKATLAGLPPTCSSWWPDGMVTASTRASPTTRVRTGESGALTTAASGIDHVGAAEPTGTVEAVLAVDGADGSAARAHDEGVGARRLRAVAHAAEQLAVRDAGGDEEALARDQVVGGQDAVEVVAGVEGLLALLVVLGPEPALDDAAGALDGARGDDALRRAADAEQQVDAGVGTGRHDGTRDVP